MEYTESGYGTSYTLDFPYGKLLPTFTSLYHTADSNDTRRVALDAIEFILSHSGTKTIYVIRGSKWAHQLQEWISLGRIKECDLREAGALLMTKKHFVLFDTIESVEGFGRDIIATFGCYPPGYLTLGHLLGVCTHGEYLLEIVQLLAKTAARIGKKFVCMVGRDFESEIVGDLLYLLSDDIEAMAIPFMNCQNSAGIDRFPFIGSEMVGSLDRKRYAFFIYNLLHVDNRDFSIANFKCDFYFLHGSMTPRSNSSLFYPPFLFWGVSFTGSGRFRDLLWGSVLPLFGIKSPNRTSCMDILRGIGNRLPHIKMKIDDWNDLDHEGKILSLAPSSSMPYYHAMAPDFELLDTTDAILVITIRDMRDVAVAALNDYAGASIRYSGISREEYNKYLKEIINKRINYITQKICHFYNHSRVIFIKFEDIHYDPVNTVNAFLDRLPFADDPYRIQDAFSEYVTQAAHYANPYTGPRRRRYEMDAKWSATLKHPRFLRGEPGQWRDCFDEELKEYFKANDNGFTLHFGYESDNNW